MAVMFRPAGADDLHRAQELIVISINDLTERHGFGRMASVRPALFQQFSLDDDPGGLWIAEDEGEIVGTSFSWLCGDLWYLAELFIAPRMQGSGVGSELLKRAFVHADQATAGTRALITFTFNTVSQGLYIRHGMFPRLPIYMFNADRVELAKRSQPTHMNYVRAKASDLAILAEIDVNALGVSREKHHRFLLADPSIDGILFYEDDQCVGYAYVATTGHVGPLAVKRRDVMPGALRTALKIAVEGRSDQISAFIPGNSEAALRVVTENRMRITLPMVLVSDRQFGDWERYLPRNPGFM